MKKNIYIIFIAFIFSALLWGSISLSNSYITTIDIPVRITNFPDGYTTATKLPEKIYVKVRGQGWKLVSLSLNADAEYKISAGRDKGRRFVNLYNYVLENQWLTSGVDVISIYPDTLSFSIERIGEKKVKILPSVKLDFKQGYGLADEVKVYPDSVTVYGPVSMLRSISQVFTEDINLNNLDERQAKQAALQDIPGIAFADKNVNIYLNVQKILEKSFDNLPVEIIDVPADRGVVLLPGKITAGVRGGIDVISRLKPENFHVYVYYRDVVLDTSGSISPRITVPENTTFVFSKPERLRYIIKKFK